MARRLTTLLLVTTFAMAGLMTCPRGLFACPMMKRAAHECCGKRLTGPQADCCRTHVRAAVPVAAATTSQSSPAPLTAGFIGVLVASPVVNLDAFRSGRAPAARALAPPGTLFSCHTALLL